MPSGGQLFFCGHHANEHLPSLVGSGAQLLDERHFMTDGAAAPPQSGRGRRRGAGGGPARGPPPAFFLSRDLTTASQNCF